MPSCIVAIEACATAHYWAREIERCVHTVKLIPSQHVKAFLVGNKNDYNDALAIAVAASQHHIRCWLIRLNSKLIKRYIRPVS
jgi:transposase